MVTGGVCAVLDYEVEHMAEFVADMASSIAVPNSVASSSFRKFVTGILSSTRLPKSTILLGMNYLAKRVNTQKQKNVFRVNDGDIWRMLTTALILASKFLDDNTFQNKSWAEVSGIAVAELNLLEREWLQECTFNLFVNLDYSRDYTAWIKSWEEWSVLKDQALARATRGRQAPLVPAIDTDVARYGNRLSYGSWVQQQAAEYERYQAIKRGEVALSQGYRMPAMDWPASGPAMSWHNAPLTPPDSGYGTPDYLSSASSANARYNEWFSSAAASGQWNSRFQQSVPSNYFAHRHGTYSQPYGYGQTMWEHGIAECSCASCIDPVKHHAYFGQPVVG